jgi:hypothetical protein
MRRVFRRVEANRLNEVFAAAVQCRVAYRDLWPEFCALELATKETNLSRLPLKTTMQKIEHKITDALGVAHR